MLRNIRLSFLLGCAVCLASSALRAQATPRDSVLAAIQEFVRATNTNDADAMQRIMTSPPPP